MLDFRTQSQFVDATAAMMRSCIAATTSTWAVAACRGLSVWADVLAAGSKSGAPAWQPAAAAHPLSGMMMWPSVANWMTAPQLYAWSPWPWLAGNPARTAWAPFAGTWPGPSFSLWMPLADWSAWSRASVPAWNGRHDLSPPSPLAMARPQATAMRPTAPAGFSSYRSSGGHAVAQIAAPRATETELIELTATAALSPMHTMLGVWRAALGV
jgi:hypothetical protein